jgi:hypothetical protein
MLKEKLDALAQEFTANVLEVLRGASLDELGELTRRKPGRPKKKGLFSKVPENGRSSPRSA